MLGSEQFDKICAPWVHTRCGINGDGSGVLYGGPGSDQLNDWDDGDDVSHGGEGDDVIYNAIDVLKRSSL